MTLNYALFSGTCNSAFWPKFISGTEKHEFAIHFPTSQPLSQVGYL